MPQGQHIFEQIQRVISDAAGWFFVFSMNLFLGVVLYLYFSKYGMIRIGGQTAAPDFTYWGWLTMLFSAGMGIGLVFWSVAEPIAHYVSPPMGQGKTIEAAELAMNITLLHWGVHAWGVYALVGLALAFFAFNQGLPLAIRSVFFPLLGDKIYGPIGHLIDTVAAVATVFGIATSLGLGVQQINAGLSYVFGLPESIGTQVVLIAGITCITIVSVVLGLDRGIKRLSEFNIGLAGVLLLFVIVAGPTLFFFNSLIQNAGSYLYHLPQLSLWTEAYQSTRWQDNWTVFYWAWWIAWSPFVGMFLARISRGRTIREFVFGVVVVPFIMTFIWLTAFGNFTLYEELFAQGGMATVITENPAVGLFVLLGRYPVFEVSAVIGIILVVIFFVTSADSGAYVIGIITAGGQEVPSVALRVLWAVLGSVAAVGLLIGGGLVALRTVSIVSGLPFAIVLMALCVSLLIGLREESMR
tara:strand:- start:1312 stop:2715 length:1404 start_codon:yes stop_codon:yes gene_type:complete